MKCLVRINSIFLILSASLSAGTVCGQSSNAGANLDYLKNVIPPSPDAGSLGKYADWPVNLYTGLPTIDIPLYELKGHSTSVPISLSYHASGIKVGETASSAGLGWSLNAGGVITRSVVGLPDDGGSTGYLAMRQYYNNPANLSSGSVPANQDSTFTVQAGEGIADGTPDIYMLNALGRSYKLFFSGNGTILTEPYSSLKISCNWTDSLWQVIMEDGTVLNFGGTGAVESITNIQAHGGEGNGTSFLSSWYLKSIVTSTGEVINFSYVVMGSVQHTMISQTDYLVNTSNTNPLTPGYGTNYRYGLATCGCFLPSYDANWGSNILNTIGLQNTSGVSLSSIQTDLGRVDFFSDATQRKDLQGSYALDSIKVFNKLSGTYIREFILSHSYTLAASSITADQSAPDSFAYYRLHLDSLTEISIDKSSYKKWKFLYNSQHLPALTSFAQDHLGYFNGAVNNPTLSPVILTPLANYCAGFGPPDYEFGNRSFAGAPTLAESLNEIIYPTGGYTIFNMEPNSYAATQNIQSPGGISDQLDLSMTSPNPFTNTKSDTFHISQPQFVNLQGDALFSSDIAGDFGATTVIAQLVIAGISSGNSTDGGTESFNKNTGSLNLWYFLKDTGTYVLSFQMPQFAANSFGSSTSYADLQASFSVTKALGMQPAQVFVGGLRIKSQFIYDGINSATPAIQRYYQYSSPLVLNPIDTINNYLSSLQVELGTSEVNEGGSSCVYATSRSGVSCWQNYLVRYSNSKNSLGTVQGGPIGYGQVEVLEDSVGTMGYTIYNYYNNDDDLGVNAAFVFPYPPVCSTDWRRGLLLQQTTYNSAGHPLTRQVNNYSFVQKPTITGFVAGSQIHYGQLALQQADMNRLGSETETEQIQKTSSVMTTYDPAENDSAVVVTNYYYDDTLNMQPVRTVSLDSKQDTVLIYSRTALEEAAINASIPLSGTAITAIDTMINRNIISVPLESERYVGGTLVYKSLTNYQVQPTGLVLPANIMLENSTYPIETRFNFLEYDNYGNMLEQAKASDVNHNYIYDYSGNYPIAEVLNADSTSIAYTSFEANGSGNWTIASTLRDPYAVTGQQCYNLTNGTCSRIGLKSTIVYVVSYWNKTGSSYTINGTTGIMKGAAVTVNGQTWTYFEHAVTGVTSVTVSSASGGDIDELRLYPSTAQMKTYTYSPLVGMSSSCDAENRTTYYSYDGLGRLAYVTDQNGNIIKTYQYHYVGQPTQY